MTQRYVDYCEARAAGGAALILLESMYVDPAGKNRACAEGVPHDPPGLGRRQLAWHLAPGERRAGHR